MSKEREGVGEWVKSVKGMTCTRKNAIATNELMKWINVSGCEWMWCGGLWGIF